MVSPTTVVTLVAVELTSKYGPVSFGSSQNDSVGGMLEITKAHEAVVCKTTWIMAKMFSYLVYYLK